MLCPIYCLNFCLPPSTLSPLPSTLLALRLSATCSALGGILAYLHLASWPFGTWFVRLQSLQASLECVLLACSIEAARVASVWFWLDYHQAMLSGFAG